MSRCRGGCRGRGSDRDRGGGGGRRVIEVDIEVRQTTIRGEKKIGRGEARDETRERTGAKGRQR